MYVCLRVRVCSCVRVRVRLLTSNNRPDIDAVPLLESLTDIFHYNPDEMGVPYHPEHPYDPARDEL